MPDAFKGTHTALVTPFDAAGTIDERRLRALVRRQVEAGVTGIVACGTTGEAATMTRDEQLHVIETVLDEVGGRVAVTAGAGGNGTQDIIDFCHRLEGLPVDAVLVVVPYYNKPTHQGMREHFRAVADAATAPVMLYNVPGRTARNMPPSVTLALAEHPNVGGVKEASGDLEQVGHIVRDAPAGFAVLSGDDALTLPMMALGGVGVVSVVANADPARMSRMVGAALDEDFEEARRVHHELSRLMSMCFVESNPIPVKHAVARLTGASAHYRLPLVPLDDTHHEALETELERLGLLPRRES